MKKHQTSSLPPYRYLGQLVYIITAIRLAYWAVWPMALLPRWSQYGGCWWPDTKLVSGHLQPPLWRIGRSSCSRSAIPKLTHLPLVPHTCVSKWIGSASVQKMAYRLVGAKPLSKPMLDYCQQLEGTESSYYKGPHFPSPPATYVRIYPALLSSCPSKHLSLVKSVLSQWSTSSPPHINHIGHSWCIHTARTKQNGPHLADDFLKWISMNETVFFLKFHWTLFT